MTFSPTRLFASLAIIAAATFSAISAGVGRIAAMIIPVFAAAPPVFGPLTPRSIFETRRAGLA